MDIDDLNGEEIIGTFYANEQQKPNQKQSRIDKAIRKKGSKLYVKWKGQKNSFNNCIDKNDVI